MTSLRDQPSLRVAAVPHRGPYWQIGQAFTRLQAALDGSGLPKGSARLIGVYYDDPAEVPEAALRSDAGVILDQAQPVPNGLNDVTVDGGPFISLTHRGPYERLPAAWSELKQALRDLGKTRRAGPSYEIYLNTPADVAPEELVTDIYIPVG